MIDIKFMLARKEDLDSIMSMFTEAINEMNKNHIYQWDSVYPDRDTLEDDIKKKQLYIGLHEGEVVSAYVLNKECDEEYVNGAWECDDSTYCVLHRLCVNPTYQNKKVGTSTVIHLENQLKNMGVESIRLDAFTLNPYAVKMYEKLGYSKVGYADLRMGKFYLMEKKI